MTETFHPAHFAHLLLLIGVVIVVAASVSGLLERWSMPPVAVFLALGAALGPLGLGLAAFGLESPALGAVATLSLILVLFTDAVSLDFRALRAHIGIALLVLGPGTLVTAAIIAAASVWLLDLSLAQAAILGAALASTDPVMVRGLLRRSGVPDSAKTALGVESGLNDVVLLPIVLVATAMLVKGSGLEFSETARVVGEVLILGPLAGVGVGFLAVRLLEQMRNRFGMRRDYESLYVLGVSFTAYALAESMHASGFMAAFAAGLTVALVGVELCDCFHDYGEATAEAFLLFAFVAIGGSVIWSGLDVISANALLFAFIALFARSVVLAVALSGSEMDAHGRRMTVWFGPKGLSSLLLVLLPIFAGADAALELFPICALVVLLSVVVHGGMPWFLAPHQAKDQRNAPRNARGSVSPEARHDTRAETRSDPPLVANRVLITFDEVQRLRDAGHSVTILDSRTPGSFAESDRRATGAVRLPPDEAVESAARLALPRSDWLVAFCA